MQSRQQSFHQGSPCRAAAAQQALAPRMRAAAWGALALGAAMAFAAPSARAQLIGDLQARMRITTGCVITGNTGGATSTNFGTLDFGTHAPTVAGVIDVVATGGGAGGTGATQITCSADVTALSITIGPGLHLGQGAVGTGTRAMQSGASYIRYDIYQDILRSTAYPTSAVSNVSITTPGAPFTLPIYGRVSLTGTPTVPAGIYTDTVAVTLSF